MLTPVNDCPVCLKPRGRSKTLPEDRYCRCSRTALRLKVAVGTYGERCFYCGTEPRAFGPDIPSRLVLDHVVPKARAGPSAIWNLVPCCSSCTGRKGTESVFSFSPERGLEWERVALRFRTDDGERRRSLIEAEKQFAGMRWGAERP